MDEREQILALQAQVAELLSFKRALEAAGTIPYNVDSAFRERLASQTKFGVSSKSADAEDVTINEAGAAVKEVLADPVGFIDVDLEDGTTVAVPYFSI